MVKLMLKKAISMISITDCDENSHVNNLKGSKSKTVDGWTFHDIEVGPWNGGDFGDCRSKSSWFGYSYLKNDDSSISTTLNGKGKAILKFGNCWKNGIVIVYKNDVELKSVGAKSEDNVEFDFEDGDVLKITEKGNGIIQFNDLKFLECGAEEVENFCAGANSSKLFV